MTQASTRAIIPPTPCPVLDILLIRYYPLNRIFVILLDCLVSVPAVGGGGETYAEDNPIPMVQ